MDTFLGIDGGGSSTWARVEDEAGSVLFERSVGPTNPSSVTTPVLEGRFDELLDGCPQPSAAVVCLAGLSNDGTRRDSVAQYFDRRFSGVTARLEPDSVAALACFPSDVTACVVAGSGSMVCSRAANGDVVASGGRGFLLGDPGSAFRLGQRLLAHHLDAPDADGPLGSAIEVALGAPNARSVMATVYGSRDPVTLIARTAPLLTMAAEEGRSWAIDALDDEMRLLASVVARHLEQHDRGDRHPTVGVVGGVWSSEATVQSFDDALSRQIETVTLVRASRAPVQGAVLLARKAVA